MKAAPPASELTLWRSEKLFNIDFASYTLHHHGFPRHFHDHYVIELVVNGADRFYCDGKTYTARHDQLVLINPGEVHTGNTLADEPLHYFSFYPTHQALQQVAAGMNITLPGDTTFKRSLSTDPLLAAKMKRLFLSFTADSDVLMQEELFFDLMAALFSLPQNTTLNTGNEDDRIKLLTTYIRSHFRETISLEQMAAIVRLNPFHLVRLFKKRTGLSPYNYLLILRTEYAKELLCKGYKVNEAATAAGFYDTSHLHRLLRKFTATSPKSFLSSKSQFCTSFIA